MKAVFNAFINSIYLLLFPIWIGLGLFFAGLLALPAIQHGDTPAIALLQAMATRNFVTIFISILWLLLTAINLLDPPRRTQRDIFLLLRSLGTLLIAGYLVIFIIVDVIDLSFYKFMHDILNSLSVLMTLLYMWTFPPSPIYKLMHRLVNYEKWSAKFDERLQFIWRISAASALYWVLGIIFVFGSLYDITVTHQWPVRSVAETVVIFIVWVLVYRYREKRM